MTNDAAVAWRYRHSWYDSNLPGNWAYEDCPEEMKLVHRAIGAAGLSVQAEPLYSATTVAELRAEVERLRVQLAGCGVIALSNTSDSLAEQMPPTSAYGWSPSLVEVHDAVFREIQNRKRADAAERRVAHLMEAISNAESGMTSLFESGDYGIDDEATEQGFAILEDIRAAVPGIREWRPPALTKETP